MSVSVDTGGAKGKRSLNAELNLVPYIDLLTCMVSFLLITAVWTQLAGVHVSQKTPGNDPGTDSEPPPSKLLVLVHKAGFNLVAASDQQPLELAGGRYDFDRLATELRKIKTVQNDRTDIQIASEDDIVFDTIMQTMDAARGAGFVDVSLVDASSAGT